MCSVLVTQYFCEQIVLQDPADDDSSARIDAQDQQEDGEPQREDYGEDHVVGDEIPRLELINLMNVLKLSKHDKLCIITEILGQNYNTEHRHHSVSP